jgi:hypothetical protein
VECKRNTTSGFNINLTFTSFFWLPEMSLQEDHGGITIASGVDETQLPNSVNWVKAVTVEYNENILVQTAELFTSISIILSTPKFYEAHVQLMVTVPMITIAVSYCGILLSRCLVLYRTSWSTHYLDGAWLFVKTLFKVFLSPPYKCQDSILTL